MNSLLEFLVAEKKKEKEKEEEERRSREVQDRTWCQNEIQEKLRRDYYLDCKSKFFHEISNFIKT